MKNLIICNNVYQIMVALWIVYKDSNVKKWDIILSNHMNNSKQIAERLKTSRLFDKVYHVETLDLIRNSGKNYNRWRRFINAIFPLRHLNDYVKLSPIYTDVYFANFDNFSQILYNALKHGNKNLKLHAYEEGLASYSSFEKYYFELANFYGVNKTGIRKIIHKYIYRTSIITGNLEEFLLFNPKLLQWNPECKICELPKINIEDEQYKQIINNVFAYDPSLNEYDRKYIFFEESFYADGSEINDVELVEELARRVGKENIIIKIHPRNPSNRFGKLGYKTNTNTSIPWEVIVMNIDNLTEKKLITVASSCILNPIIVFGQNVKAYSLFECINYVPPILQGGYWNLVSKVYDSYPDMICKCKSIQDILI